MPRKNPDAAWQASNDYGPMASANQPTSLSRPLLLCFDGSEDASAAICRAGEVLKSNPAVVLTVWEPFAVWEPYDPATILSAPFEKRASKALALDEIAEEVAQEKMAEGLSRAVAAGFTAEGRTAKGKAWRTICSVAEEIDASVIVLGARGLSRVGSVLLGSVSSAVSVHAKRPVLIVPAGS
jgi:nucleotide-binding universal stress UspA family protein